jgi:hypothetical protein
MTTSDEPTILAWLLHTENIRSHDGPKAVYEGQVKEWRRSCASFFIFNCQLIELPNKKLADFIESERKRALQDLATLLEQKFREEMNSESAYGHVLVVKHGEWMIETVRLGEADCSGEGKRPDRHCFINCTYAFFKAGNME